MVKQASIQKENEEKKPEPQQPRKPLPTKKQNYRKEQLPVMTAKQFEKLKKVTQKAKFPKNHGLEDPADITDYETSIKSVEFSDLFIPVLDLWGKEFSLVQLDRPSYNRVKAINSDHYKYANQIKKMMEDGKMEMGQLLGLQQDGIVRDTKLVNLFTMIGHKPGVMFCNTRKEIMLNEYDVLEKMSKEG